MWQPHVQCEGSLDGELLLELRAMPSTIFGKGPMLLKDMLSGLDRRTSRVGAGVGVTVEDSLISFSIAVLMGLIIGSDVGLGTDVLEDHNPGCDETDNECSLECTESFLLNISLGRVLNFAVGSDSGRRKDTVLDRLKDGLSKSSSVSDGGGFLISGSLFSSFPFLSDAKYSSPRPNTT